MVCNALTHSAAEDSRNEVMQIIPSYRIAYRISFLWLPCFNVQDKQGLQLFDVLHDHCLLRVLHIAKNTFSMSENTILS